MDARDPAKAVEILDRLLTFLGEDERWIKGRFSDRHGKCSLVGALDLVSGRHGGEAAERYLADVLSDRRDRRVEDGVDCVRLRAALRRAARGERYQASEAVLRRDSLADFNDGCHDFAELRALIEQARAQAKKDAVSRTRPRLGVGSGELVMGCARRRARIQT